MNEAIILAGGFGTRLKSVLSDLPKPMAPIQDKPFLMYLLDKLAQNNFSRVVISVGYLKEKIIQYFGYEYKKIEIVYAEEDTPLGTGGAIQNSLQKLSKQNSACIVFNGDSFLDFDLTKALNFHRQQNALCTIISNQMKDASRYGLINTNGERINSFTEKKQNSSGYINSGIYIFNPKLLSCELENLLAPFSFEKFLENNIDKLQINAFKTEGYFIDIGIPEDYIRAQKELPKLFSFI